MKVLGLAGLKGSGKDAFADRLSFALQQLGVWCLRKAFADALKQTLQTAFQFSDHQLTDPIAKETVDPRWGVSPRQAMRAIGEGFRTGISPDFWVKRLDITVRTFTDINFKPACLLVTDVRNDIEADWVKRQGKLILVSRPQSRFDGHSTEEMGTRPASFFDYVVHNNASLVDLTDRANELAQALLPWLQAPEAKGSA